MFAGALALLHIGAMRSDEIIDKENIDTRVIEEGRLVLLAVQTPLSVAVLKVADNLEGERR